MKLISSLLMIDRIIFYLTHGNNSKIVCRLCHF